MPTWKKIALEGTHVSFNNVTGSIFSGSFKGDGSQLVGITASAIIFPYTGSAIISGSLDVTGSLNVSGSLIVNGLIANNEINTDAYSLYDSNTTTVINWEEKNLYDNNGQFTLNWDTRFLFDVNGNVSVNWNDRILYDSNGSAILNWETSLFNGTSKYALSASFVSSSNNNYFPILFLDNTNDIENGYGKFNIQGNRPLKYNPSIGVLLSNTFSGSLQGTSSWANNALTASFLPSGTYNISASYAISTSHAVSASYAISASYATTALSASYATTALSASYATTALSASYVFLAISSSHSIISNQANTASVATIAITANTASFINDLNQTLHVTALTSSGVAEIIQYWEVQDSTSVLSIQNASSTNGTYIPYINSTQDVNSINTGLIISSRIGNDSGSNVAMIFDARSGSAAVVQNRSLFLWRNYNQNYMTLDASGNLGLGTTTPGAKFHVVGAISGSSINLTGNSIIKGSSATTGNALELYNSGNSLVSYFPNSGGLGTKTIGTPATPSSGNGQIFIDSIAKILAIKTDDGVYKANSYNASTGSQSGFSTDTYLTDSDLIIPSWGLQQKTTFLWNVMAHKTNASTATPIYNIRIGSARTTSDTARLTLTGPAQTAIVDSGSLWVMVTVTATGSATVFQGTAWWNHQGTAANATTQGTGFANNGTGHTMLTSAAFSGSALAGQYIGLSINGGTSAVWTVRQVKVEANW